MIMDLMKKFGINFVLILTLLLGFFFMKMRIDQLERNEQIRYENVIQRDLGDGSVESGVDVVTEEDINRLRDQITKDLKALEKELKKSDIESITQIKLEIRDQLERIHVSESTDEAGNQYVDIDDPFFRLKLNKETLDPVNVQHAPIKIELINTKQDNFKNKLYAVARNGWNNEIIDQIEVEQSFNSDFLKQTSYYAGGGVVNSTFFVTIEREKHNSIWGIIAGYDLVDKEYQVGVTKKWKLNF